jgi:hypothetical protein
MQRYGLLKAAYLTLAGVGYTAVGIHLELAQTSAAYTAELRRELKTHRDLLFKRKQSELKV